MIREDIPAAPTPPRVRFTFDASDFIAHPHGICAQCLKECASPRLMFRISRCLPGTLAAELVGNMVQLPSIAWSEFHEGVEIPSVSAFVDLVRVLGHGVIYADVNHSPIGDAVAVTRRKGTALCGPHAAFAEYTEGK